MILRGGWLFRFDRAGAIIVCFSFTRCHVAVFTLAARAPSFESFETFESTSATAAVSRATAETSLERVYR